MMALYELYSRPYRKIYKSSLFSKAFLFQIVAFALTVICPLLIAYRSQGFWLKINTYREIPSVRFKYDYLIYLQGDRPDSYFLWTSFPGLAQLEDAHLRVPVVRVYEPDIDKDGKTDYIEFKVTFPMDSGETVREATVILIFDYRLQLHSRFQMQTMTYCKLETLTGGVALDVEGDLKIMQKMPLRYRGVDRRFDVTIVNRTSLDAKTYRFSTLLQKYHARNITTKLEPITSNWLPGNAGVTGKFQLNMRINYAEDTFQYWTGFWELIKWAWIQYLSILVVFIFAMKRIREYVFRNRLVTTVPVDEGAHPTRATG